MDARGPSAARLAASAYYLRFGRSCTYALIGKHQDRSRILHLCRRPSSSCFPHAACIRSDINRLSTRIDRGIPIPIVGLEVAAHMTVRRLSVSAKVLDIERTALEGGD